MGAEVTAISEQIFQRLGGVRLLTATKVLYGPARHTLDVLGQFTTTLRHGDHSTAQSVFVVRGLKNNLLGLPAIVSLQLIQRVYSIRTDQAEGGSRATFYTPRSVAIPLRSKVKEELHRMEAMGVISKISDPTPWCAGMHGGCSKTIGGSQNLRGFKTTKPECMFCGKSIRSQRSIKH